MEFVKPPSYTERDKYTKFPIKGMIKYGSDVYDMTVVGWGDIHLLAVFATKPKTIGWVIKESGSKATAVLEEANYHYDDSTQGWWLDSHCTIYIGDADLSFMLESLFKGQATYNSDIVKHIRKNFS